MARKYSSKPEVGCMYRVRFRSDSVERTLTGSYMGRDYADRWLFSLRPLAGTTTLCHEQIIWIDEMPRATQPQLPRTVCV